ncbi:hypothetical protein BX600DRAFT_456317 [Xylariales sp. PMI_506]|nr:hypothetical protein BX600DRAFT_456317 [Xylariales sp. PMI_506]
MEVFGDPLPPLPPQPDTKKRSNKTPQEILSDFWDKFHTKTPGKVTSIFPRSLYQNILPPQHPAGARSSLNAAESYEAAAKECREKVKRIVRECNRTNEKFTDPDFDIENDPDNNCLNGLVRDSADLSAAADPGAPVSAWDVKNSLEVLAQSQMLGSNGTVTVDPSALGRLIGSDQFFPGRGVSSGESYSPGSIHRVDWIFESPQFTINGFSSSDIKQGANGDCWWLAAVATIAHRKDLMDKVCVARDEECGVYGFVFQRDGEWISTVVDDNLYLNEEDFDYYGDVYDSTGRRSRKHRKEKQTGSEALYFAHCEDPNETWLPLLEKAYSKVHGDYEAVSGGWPGEAVEDMTGGVTTTIASNRVLRKDKLWKELVNSDGEFVFALAAMGTGWDWQKSGLALGHAYSILEAREEVAEDGSKIRLVKIRNPWGQRSEYGGVGEWNGPWSDGSKEWTPYWLKKMNHTFGDDGVFWMSYSDMLNTFMYIHRTRLFDQNWRVVSQWTSAQISWVTGYLQTKFKIEVKKGGRVVIVLTQLDDRYFRGFEGEYYFELHFLLQEVGAQAGEHICRVRPVHKWENRSVSCEVELEAGVYEVLPKITASRNSNARAVEDVVKEYAEKNPQKLRQVGMQYDLAHAKGGILDEDEILEKKKAEEKTKKEEKKRKRKAKKKKALREAAEAMEKATDAIKEVVKSEEEGSKTEKSAGKAADPKSEVKTDSKEATDPKVTEKTSGSGPSTSGAKPERPSQPVAMAPAQSGPESGIKDAPIPPTEEEKKSEEPKPEESKPDEQAKSDAAVQETAKEDDLPPEEDKKDEEDDDEEDESETEEDKPDEDGDDVTSRPWNAVVCVSLRVYAHDPEVAITLEKATAAEEASTLVVEGQPAGATL